MGMDENPVSLGDYELNLLTPLNLLTDPLQQPLKLFLKYIYLP